jgi:quinol monooxygenase YgiN
MVLPLVDEDKPKCFLCHDMFENIEDLQKHQKTVHSDFFEFHEDEQKRKPAPGDVSIF